jgi:SUN domain-containing protein 1/2
VLQEKEEKLRERMSSLEDVVLQLTQATEKAKLESAVPVQIPPKEPEPALGLSDDTFSSLIQPRVQVMIDRSLEKYSRDRIGLPDYALQSSGAKVMKEWTSPTYLPFDPKEFEPPRSGFPFNLLMDKLGVEWVGKQPPLLRGPQSALHPDISNGNCWAMQGSEGRLTVSLSRTILPTAITLEHVPATMALKEDVRSAPKQFEVWSVSEEGKRLRLLTQGEYRVIWTEDESPVQTFLIDQVHEPVRHVQLHVLSNYGHDQYTCLYRFRVHGQ